MPPATRSTDPLQHVLQTVLEATEESDPCCRAMDAAGVETIDDLLGLTREDLKSLTWTNPPSQTSESLPIAKINILLSIRTWFQSQVDNDDTVFLSPDR